MLYTTRGWNDITHETGETISTMLIVNTDNKKGSWQEFKDLFSKIEQIATDMNLVEELKIDISKDMLIVVFHTHNEDAVPKTIRTLTEKISELIEFRNL